MFARIAPRYDLMNALMTGGRDHAWRRAAARLPRRRRAPRARSRHRHRRPRARAPRGGGRARGDRRRLRRGHAPPRPGEGSGAGERRVRFLAGDALALPFADASFGCVASAFLLRNLADLRAGLAEMRRVTAPGGSVVALEITQPTLPRLAPGLPPLLPPRRPEGGRPDRGEPRRVHVPPPVRRPLRDAGRARAPHGGGRAPRRPVRRVGLGTVTIHVGHVGHAGRDPARRARGAAA